MENKPACVVLNTASFLLKWVAIGACIAGGMHFFHRFIA